MRQEGGNINRRKFLVGAGAAFAAGMVPGKAEAVRHPIDLERETADAEALEIEEKMREYHAFIEEKAYFIQRRLLDHQVFEMNFVEVFKSLLKEYVYNAVKTDRTGELDGLRVLIDHWERIHEWMIDEIKRRWKVVADGIKRERIRTLLFVLSDLARKRLIEKHAP